MQIIPTQSRRISKTFYIENIEAWKNFAQRITKNPFVKEFLLSRDGNKCSWCTKRMINSLVVHHTSYEHHCSYNVVKRVNAATENRPFKTRVVPDCEGCKKNSLDRFLECMSKLALVHTGCNKAIANSFRNLSLQQTK